MKDKGIIAGALVCIFAGMVILCAITWAMQPAQTEIASISKDESGKYVACTGIVYSVTPKEEHCFVKIFDGCSIDIPLFNFDGTISIGDMLYVEGTVTVYNDVLEILPEKISISEIIYGTCTDSVFYTEKGVFDVSLDEGIHAVCGTITDGNLHIDKDLPLNLFTEVNGKICQSGNKFRVFGTPFTYIWGKPVQLGEISGIGIQDNGYVYMVYCQWNSLPVCTIAEAIQNPEGYPVTITGTIISIRSSQGHVFLTISDMTDHILIPVFKSQHAFLGVDGNTFYTGQTITVTGITDVYKGQFEILPEDIDV